MASIHNENLKHWQHTHTFGQEIKRPGELRTVIVIAVTGIMMVVEISAGILFGSMALLADGLHMASHAVALSINAFVYIYARRHAADSRFSFGTGKMNALGGFTGAILLAIFALLMVIESVERFIFPIGIAYNQAILVAVLGLIVNGVSVLILGHHHNHDTSDASHENRHHDHNLRAAYLHVLADVLTSILAICALLTAKYYGMIWMDPLMGVLGAFLVTRWSVGLLRETSSVLLDRQGPVTIRDEIRNSIERVDGNRVVDLHLWVIGPNLYSAIISIVSHAPKPSEHYKNLIPNNINLAHVTIELNKCSDNSVR